MEHCIVLKDFEKAIAWAFLVCELSTIQPWTNGVALGTQHATTLKLTPKRNQGQICLGSTNTRCRLLVDRGVGWGKALHTEQFKTTSETTRWEQAVKPESQNNDSAEL